MVLSFNVIIPTHTYIHVYIRIRDLFINASEKVHLLRDEVDGKPCYWMRGILRKHMTRQLECPSIIDARIWESGGFIEAFQ